MAQSPAGDAVDGFACFHALVVRSRDGWQGDQSESCANSCVRVCSFWCVSDEQKRNGRSGTPSRCPYSESRFSCPVRSRTISSGDRTIPSDSRPRTWAVSAWADAPSGNASSELSEGEREDISNDRSRWPRVALDILADRSFAWHASEPECRDICMQFLNVCYCTTSGTRRLLFCVSPYSCALRSATCREGCLEDHSGCDPSRGIARAYTLFLASLEKVRNCTPIHAGV